MAERALFTRLGVKDTEKAIGELNKFGERGSAALGKVGTAVEPVNRALQRLDGAVKNSGLSLSNMAARAGPVGGVLAALGPVGIAAAAGIATATAAFVGFSRAVDNADNLAKTADRLAISIEGLQEFRFAAQIAGVEASQFDQSIEKLTRSVGEAATKPGTAADAFERLGINIRGAGGVIKDTDALLPEIAESLAGVSSNAERASIAADLFGRSGLKLLNFLNLGAEGMAELQARARELGIILSEEAARGAEETADALAIFGAQIDVSVDKILLSFAPAITSAVTGLSELIVAIKDFQIASDAVRPVDLSQIDSLTSEERAARLVELRRQIEGTVAALEKADGAGAANTSKFLEDLLVRFQVEREALEAAGKKLVIDVAPAAGLSEDQRAAMLEDLEKLRGALDPVVKLEQDRAKALAEVAENAAALSDGERLKFEAEINEIFDERLAGLERLAAGQDDHATAVDKTKTEYEKLIASLDKVAAAEQALERDTAILTAAFDNGLIDISELSAALDLLAARYDKARASADGLTSSSRAVASSAPASLRTAANDFDNIFAGAIRGGLSQFADGGGVDLSAIGSRISSGVFDRVLDNVFDSFSASSSGGGFSFNPTSLFSGFEGIANLGTNVAAGGLNAALFGSAPIIGELGAGSAIAGTTGLLGSGGALSLSAAAGPLALAAAGLFTLVSVLGEDVDYPFGLGEVQVTGGRAVPDELSELDGGPIDEIRQMQEALAEVLNGFFDGLGATLTDIDDLVRIGFSSGRKSILPKGFFAAGIDAAGDFATGADFAGIEDPEEALARALQIGISKAIAEGIVEGLSEADSAALALAAGNLRAGGFTSLEETIADIDFAATLDDFIFEVGNAGDALALQTRGIGAAVSEFSRSQLAFVADFKEKAERLFAAVDATASAGLGGSGVAGLDGHISDGINSPADIAYTVIQSSINGKNGSYSFGAGVRGIYETGRAGQGVDLTDFRQVETRRNPTDRAEVTVPSFRTFGAFDESAGALTPGAIDGLELTINGQAVHLLGGELGGFGADTRDRFRIEGTQAVIQGQRFQDIHGIEQLVFNTAHLTALLEANGISTTPGDTAAAETPATLEAAREALKDYARGLVDQIAGLEGTSEAMTAWELRIYEGTAQINAMADVLEEAGLTTAEATEVMADGVTRLASEVRDDFNDKVGRQYLAATNPAALAISDMLETWEDMRDQAEAVGGDMDAVNQLIEEQAKALTGEAEARRENIATLTATVSSLNAASDAIEQTRFGLVTGSSSSLFSETGKIDELEKAFAAAIEGAEGGDADAARQVQTIGTQLFNLSGEVFASGAAAVAIQQNVSDEMQRVGLEIRSQAAIAEDQLTTLQAIEANTRAGRPSASSERDFGAKSTRNRMLADLFPEFTADFGQGQYGGFIGSISASDPRQAIARSIIEEISFAGGGEHAGGLRFVGERGVELEATGRSRILSNNELKGMLGGGSSGGDRVAHGLLEDIRAELQRFGRRLVDQAGQIGRLEVALQPAIGARV